VRALLQRVSEAEVRVGGVIAGQIGVGLVVLLGIGKEDTEIVGDVLARRITELRIFPDEMGKINRSLMEVAGEALVVSQFTLYADTRRGRRPGFTDAAPPELAEHLYERFCASLEALEVPVEQGVFGAEMDVALVNDGPFTIWLDTDQSASG
jgi:D-tyrosyl-tRNA(Tyr) deacylase